MFKDFILFFVIIGSLLEQRLSSIDHRFLSNLSPATVQATLMFVYDAQLANYESERQCVWGHCVVGTPIHYQKTQLIAQGIISVLICSNTPSITVIDSTEWADTHEF